jgi:hypothetical protein
MEKGDRHRYGWNIGIMESWKNGMMGECKGSERQKTR